MKKRSGDFTCVYQKLWSDDLWFLRYGAQLTDRRKKWYTKVGDSLKNLQQAFARCTNHVLDSF